MTTQPLLLGVGRWYIDTAGEVRGPMEWVDHGDGFDFSVGPDYQRWYDDHGRAQFDHPDLIAEVPAPPPRGDA